MVHREHGCLEDRRPYFYILPYNQKCRLFEKIGMGWVISLADKVGARDMFVRKGDVWDVVSVLEAAKGQIRISSQRLSSQHLLMPVYVERLINKIDLFNFADKS